jgi:hypothetical protein
VTKERLLYAVSLPHAIARFLPTDFADRKCQEQEPGMILQKRQVRQ